jgi:hypothetical protein
MKIIYINKPMAAIADQVITALGKSFFLLNNSHAAAAVKTNAIYLKHCHNTMTITINILFPPHSGKRNRQNASIKNPEINKNIISAVKASKSFTAVIMVSLGIPRSL